MDNILEQIQSLTDKFNNLFEVEGLGEPSGDVPPSTNKIKKDKKTKDGKVELVSVEDELFPKEGNAKEQFRQKVIDKINGMIQGTATLEDLLQLVRSKQVKPVKEGFEGAIEILEDLMSYIIETNLINRRDQHHISKKSVADTEEELKNSPLLHAQSLERMRFGYNNGKDDRKDVAQYRIGMHDGAKSPTHAYKPEYRYDSDSTPADRAEETKSRIRRAHNIETDEETDESFEGAIEILERLLAEADHHANKKNPVVKITDKNYGVASGKGLSGPFNKNHVGQYIVYNKDTDASYLVTPDNWKKSKIKKDLEAQGKFYEAFEQSITQIEDLLQCLGESKSVAELPSVAEKVRPQRKAEADKAHAELERVTHLNPYSMPNGELSKKQKNVIAKAIDKASRADARLTHANNIINKPKKEEKYSGIKFDKILCNLEEAMDIIEATVGKLATSSAKSVEPRRKEYQDLTSKARKATGAEKVMLNAKAQKAQKRYAHALELNTLHLPKDSKVSANKLFKSADKSVEGRKRQDKYKRYTRAWNIADANPVKTNEGFDSFKIKDYNEEELVKLVEEVINEISDKKYREKLEELKDGIKKAKEFQKDTKDEIIKDKLDDAIIPQEHRLNVSQDKYEDRVVKREKEKYERSKAKKGK